MHYNTKHTRYAFLLGFDVRNFIGEAFLWIEEQVREAHAAIPGWGSTNQPMENGLINEKNHGMINGKCTSMYQYYPVMLSANARNAPTQHLHGFQVHWRGISTGVLKGIFKMFQQSF